jgi:hypothetical protein
MDSPTHPFDMIDDRMVDVLRAKTEADRLAIAHGLWRSAGRMLHSMLHADHPDWSYEQLRHEVARRLSHGAV